MKKPLIVVPGIVIPELVELTGEGETYNDFIENLQRRNLDLNNLLKTEGYDLVFIEYHHGADWIQKNAKLVQTVIRLVNQEKWNNGSNEPTVVYGESMGGVVARYALCEMEANSEQHDVEHFISFDAPHNGANVPLGAQAMLGHLNSIYVRSGIIPVFKLNELVPELRLAQKGMIHNGAVQQLLIDYYFHNPKIGSANARQNLMAQLDAFGFPQQVSSRGNAIRNIILSNGSGAGGAGGLFPSHSHMVEYEGSDYIFIPIIFYPVFIPIFAGFYAEADIWSMPVNNATDLTVYHGKYYGTILGLVNVLSNKRYRVSSANGLDHVQGGTINVENLIPANVSLPSGLVFHQPEFCFVPAVSSCALLPPFRNNTTYNINANYNQTTNTWANGESDVNFVITGRNASAPENQLHLFWNFFNREFLVQQALPFPRFLPNDLPVFLNKTFNYGNNSTKTLPTISIMGTGAVRINANLPVGLAGSTSPPPANGSHFEVRTNGQNCSSRPVVVQVFNGAKLEIGDNSTANRGTLSIGAGDMLLIRNGGTLSIANNSKLVIEAGAVLEIESGAIIFLEGANAVIEIHGSLNLQNGVIFSPSKGSASHVGYIHFIRPVGFSGKQIIAEGTNSKIVMEGTSKSHLLLKVEGGELEIPHPNSNPGSYVSEFSVTDGLIEIGTNSSLLCGSTIAYTNVRTKGTVSSAGNTGIVLLGQTTYTFDVSDFRELALGMDIYNQYSANMTLEGILFKNCSLGLRVTESGINVDNCIFYDNYAGLELYNSSAQSTISNSQFFFHDTYGILQAGNQLLHVTESIFNGNETGIDFHSTMGAGTPGGTLVLECAKFYSNFKGVSAGASTVVNMSKSVSTSGLYGGNNSFWMNNYSVLLNGTQYNLCKIYLEDGENNFVGETSVSSGNNPYNFITGFIDNSILNANGKIEAKNNYWYPSPGSNISSGGANYYDVKSYFMGFNPIAVDLEGLVLSSANTACFEDPEFLPWVIPELRAPVDEKTGEKTVQNINIFPNPVNDVINIEIKADINCNTSGENEHVILSVELYNIQGQRVGAATHDTDQWLIDSRSLADGLYYVRITTSKTTITKQVRVLR